MIKSLIPWILAFRFKTLTAAVVPVLVATALSYTLNVQHGLWISIFALLSALCIQIATNLINDAVDFKKGADSAERLGPQRMTQSGRITGRQIMNIAYVFLLLAMALGIPLVLRGGWPFVGLGMLSLFLAYSYTGGPFPLAYLGLGDLFVILFFGLFAVVGTGYLHALSIHPAFIIAGLQVGFLSTTLIAVNNLRDSATDRPAGKNTLAVRFGDNFVKFEIAFLLFLTHLLQIYYWLVLGKIYVWLTLVLLPLAAGIVLIVLTMEDKKNLNRVLGLCALHQVGFAVLLSLGLNL